MMEKFFRPDPDAEYRESKIYGVVVGVVTNNKDPDKLARVKVKFPWLAEEDESDWARLATFMAGSDRGMYCVPEVGDEVLVMFEHGDINYPYVMGSVWNGKEKPHRNNEDGKNNIREFKSRSGHLFTFDDTKDDEKIIIQDKAGKRKLEISVKGKSILIENTEDKGTISLKSKGDVSIESEAGKVTIKSKEQMALSSSANTLSLESKKDMSAKSSAKLALSSKSNMTAASSAAFEATSKGKMKLASSASADISASASMNVKASASMNLKSSGALVAKGSVIKLN